MTHERYFSVDIESSGPIPGKYSMLSLGACAVDDPGVSFYVEFQPISAEFVPKALEVSGFDLNHLMAVGQKPDVAMPEFRRWVEKHSESSKPVFVGFNASYDWQFVNWYFEMYAAGNPFGFGGVDIKSYFMGLTNCQWGESTSSRLPAEFKPSTPQTHNALDDAKAQASMFAKMLAHAQSRSR